MLVPTVDYSDDAIKSYLATKVLEVGTQRVAFLLSTNKALVKAPQSRIVVTRPQGSEPLSEITADYNEWPYGVRGSYSTPIEFTEAGEYLLTVTPVGGEVEGEAHISVTVLADAPVPSVGDTPPSSQTKTLGDGLELVDVTTAYQPDAGLYEVSVADAVAIREAQRDRVRYAGVLHQPDVRAAGGHSGGTAGGASRRSQLRPR